MKKYKASRLVSGNRLFPVEVIIDNIGVTVNIPSLFSGKEKTIPFSRISAVNIENPFIDYSTIIIETTGEGQISAQGFLRNEVCEMKEIILESINGSHE